MAEFRDDVPFRSSTLSDLEGLVVALQCFAEFPLKEVAVTEILESDCLLAEQTLLTSTQ